MTPPPAAGKLAATYYYDLLGRALYYTKADATGQIQSVQYAYDVKNNLTGLTETVGNSTQGYVYQYDDDNRIIKVTLGNTTVSNTYDDFGRLTQKITTQGETEVKRETYTFVDRAVETDEGEKTYTSMQVASYAVTAGGVTTTYTYTYDKNGNILTISDGTHITRYEYDSANQLTAEYNEAGEYAHFWVYDNAGNIKSRTEYRYENDTLGELIDTVEYAYKDGYTVDPETGEDIAPAVGTAWGDLLTAYDGQGITYDDIGNPVNDGTWTYEWQRGRQLKSMSEIGGDTVWTYTYDADGMRTSRTGDGKTYTYTYNGSQLVQMTVGSDTLRFTYDAAGTPLTVTYDDDTYYYVTNVQGDVVSIVDAEGNEVASYSYDAWGKLLLPEGTATGDAAEVTSTLAELNPLRYRGYVYDNETGLYYLQSRYYDPMVGRFANGDGLVSTGQGLIGNNMFAYCNNNPVNYADPTGQLLEGLWEEFLKALQQAAGYFAAAAGVSQVDTVAPGLADILALALMFGGAAACFGYALYNVITAPAPLIAEPKVEERSEAITESEKKPTVIYRHGGTNPGNLTPKEKDLLDGRGLSFSTIPMPGSAMTTIEALNATGLVFAVQDGPTHISVYPVGGTMADWVHAGSASIWTCAVKSVVVKWDGIR